MKTTAPLLIAGVLALVLALAGGCSRPDTEVLLVVTSGLPVPRALDHLAISARGAAADGGFSHTYDLTQTPNQLPLSLGLLAAGDPSGPLHIEVTGLVGDVVVATRAIDTSFVPEEVRVLRLDLEAPMLASRVDAGVDAGVADAGPGPDAPGDAEVRVAADAATPPAADAGRDSPASDALGGGEASSVTDAPPPPPRVTLGSTSSTPLQGYVGPEATVFEDACPSGSVVIGFDTATDSQIVAQLQTMCGVPQVAWDGTSVLLTPSASLALRGGIMGPRAPSVCPKDQAVVGFSGRSSALLDELSVRCAALTLAGTAVTVGTPSNLEPVGGDGGDAFPRTDCGTGMIAVGTNIAVRNWISGFGLVCAPIGAR
jgi:hypothetical protein